MLPTMFSLTRLLVYYTTGAFPPCGGLKVFIYLSLYANTIMGAANDTTDDDGWFSRECLMSVGTYNLDVLCDHRQTT